MKNMMDIKGVLLQWFIHFFVKNPLCLQGNLLLVVLLKMKNCQTKNKLKNYINQILESLKHEEYTQLL